MAPRENSRVVTETLVVDASAAVDLLVGSGAAAAITDRLRGHSLHVPAHFDAEVLSALGRLHRGGDLSTRQVTTRIRRIESAPMERHPLPALLAGAWRRRANLRLVDALYFELAEQLDATLITTDGGLAAAVPSAEHFTRGS